MKASLQRLAERAEAEGLLEKTAGDSAEDLIAGALRAARP